MRLMLSLSSCDLGLCLCCRLVPSCFVIFDLEPLSLSFDFVFSSEIFKSLSIRLDRLCHLAILYLDQHAHTLHHLESLLTISLDILDIFEGRSCISEFVRKTLSGRRHHHLHLYMYPEIKQLAIKHVDEYGFVIRPDLVGLTSGSMRTNLLVPSCFVIFDLEPLSLSFDFVFSSEIFKFLSIRLDRLCHLAILYLHQHAHTLHHLESLLTISLDILEIFEGRSCISEFVRKTLSGRRHHHLHLYMYPEIKQLAIKRIDEYGFVIRPDLVGLTSGTDIQEKDKKKAKNKQNRARSGKDQVKSKSKCMRTRSKARRLRQQQQQQVPPNLVETPKDTMADNRTMAELLQAPTEGYEEAIVVPEIEAANFEIKHGLLTLVQNKQFFGHDKEDPHAHIRYFNKITSTLRYPNVPTTSIKLMLFPFSLEGAARIWLEKEPPRSIQTWDDLVAKFINQFFPP
ncbi:reverse transcriptase domain-containing protein, partial [Tanacetum coccineum]